MSSAARDSVDGGNLGHQERVEDSPTRDELFSVLRNQRRRFVIHHLERVPGPVDVGDLATQVAAWENRVSREAVTAKQRRRVYNALQQTHVPKLEQAGIITVDRREVSLTDLAEESDLYVEIVPGEDRPWSEYYLALGGVGVALFVTLWLDLWPLAGVSDIAAGAFLSIALVISASAHSYYQRANRIGGTDEPPELRNE
jgi:DNA-binding transcriptional ArsR family regulator